jgi:hypothetical protein
MTDLELVKLAAKAAGMEIRKPMKYRDELEAKQSGYDNDGFNWWSPLTDDGDALRLAVKLGMNIEITGSDVYACTFGNCSEPANPDPYVATRRAIVRAAAEIGKGMK